MTWASFEVLRKVATVVPSVELRKVTRMVPSKELRKVTRMVPSKELRKDSRVAPSKELRKLTTVVPYLQRLTKRAFEEEPSSVLAVSAIEACRSRCL